MSRRVFAQGLVFLLVMAGAPSASPARLCDLAVGESASIMGQVTDASGQPLPGVSVTTIPEAGGLARRATSARDGTYRYDMLPSGTYRVDFDLFGFDVTRRNHVRVGDNRSTNVDAVLDASTICECVDVGSPDLRQRAGQVLDQAGQPLPYARLEIASSTRREVAYADTHGRFIVRAPVGDAWSLTASDTGFRAVSEQVSGAIATSMLFKLAHAGTVGVPNRERFGRGCRCPGDLFTHHGR
jgi:hypothetical protein